MAITPLTGFKAFTFDGEVSTDYGVAILGEGVFNAPERDVEMITIPGRSGQFALDNGRFENIEVTYPANLIANSAVDFADALSDFRNMLCSKKGYVRLQDDYHPNEYRMAVYKEGLEVNEKVLRAGEFKITFDCKPQRWLTSGETKQTIANSGDTLTNPTLFESSPLLEIEGVGDIEFNGYTVSIVSSEIGDLSLTYTDTGNSYILDGVNQLNTGDSIAVSGFKVITRRLYRPASSSRIHSVQVYSCTGLDGTSLSSSVLSLVHQQDTLYGVRNEYTFPNISFNYGASQTISIVGQVSAVFSSGTYILSETITITYDGDDTISYSVLRGDPASAPSIYSFNVYITDPTVTAYSTKPYDYGTIYCDTDIGEFYRIEGGEYISMNHVGDLGSDLPTLAPGTNTVTYDNTITELNIAPRWWKI